MSFNKTMSRPPNMKRKLNEVYLVMIIILSAIGALLHILGSYVLLTLFRKVRQKVQWIYLINLSIAEGLNNLFLFCFEVATLVSNRLLYFEEIGYYTVTISNILSHNCYFCLIYLTLDRLVSVLLPFKYSSYWSTYKAVLLSVVTWLVLLIVSAVVLLTKIRYELYSYKYVGSTLDVLFLVIAAVSYALIFVRYSASKKSMRGRINYPSKKEENNRNRRLKMKWVGLRKSFFFTPLMLVLNFVFFYDIPNLIYLFVCLIPRSCSMHVRSVLLMLYVVRTISDALLYIFLLRRVRKWIFARYPPCYRQEGLVEYRSNVQTVTTSV